jgi:hypothetical protein
MTRNDAQESMLHHLTWIPAFAGMTEGESNKGQVTNLPPP